MERIEDKPDAEPRKTMNINAQDADSAAAAVKADSMARTCCLMAQGCQTKGDKADGRDSEWEAKAWYEACDRLRDAAMALERAQRALERLHGKNMM
jgi:hypothetical protein